VLCGKNNATFEIAYPFYPKVKAPGHSDLFGATKAFELNVPICEICLAKQIREARSLAVGAWLSLVVGAGTLFAKLTPGRNLAS
jgi:hypothetical protein